jgi:hypothetical protein
MGAAGSFSRSERGSAAHTSSGCFGHGAVGPHHRFPMTASGKERNLNKVRFGMIGQQAVRRAHCAPQRLGYSQRWKAPLAGIGGMCLRAGKLPADGGSIRTPRFRQGAERDVIGAGIDRNFMLYMRTQ